MGMYEKFAAVLHRDGLTSSEFLVVQELDDLANSSSLEVLRKVSGSIVNVSLSEFLALTNLSDVLISSPTNGQVLTYNGSTWVNADASSGGGGSGTVGPGTTNEIAYFNSSSTVTSLTTATYPSLTELSYVKGVTSAIQTQIDSKANTAGALTQFVGNGNWKVWYSDGSGDVVELALGADGTFLKSNGAASAPTFATPAGSGDVSKVGTPVDNQVGVWTGDGTLEGDADLTFDTTSNTLALAGAAGTSIFAQGGANILVDSPRGTMTLSNIDALDATTESTIEAAIDTLANLTSIQGRTVTLADAGTNAIFGWDDTAGAYENLTVTEASTIIDHDQTTNFVANEHIDHTAVTLTAGNGLTGGGDISANRTFTVGAGTGITVNADDVAVNQGTAFAWTAAHTHTVAGLVSTLTNSSDAASVQVAILQGDRATMADDDEAYLTLRLSDDGGTQKEVARLTWVATDVNAGTNVDGRIDFAVMTAGTLADELQLDGTSLSPSTTDGLSLGTSSLNWSDLFLDSGAVINWDSGDVTLTHSAAKLTFGGDGAVEIDFNNHEMTNVDINSGAIDGTAIGAASASTIIGTTIDATTDFTIGGTVITDNTITDDGTLIINATTAVSFSDKNITNVGDIALDSLTADATTIALNSNLVLSENTGIVYDSVLSADGKYSAIEIIEGTGGATIAFGDLVTLDKDDSRWELVDISVAAAATGDARGIIGIAVTSSTDGGAITVMLRGTIRADANFPALTIGAAVYASTTGDIVVTQPSTVDHVIRIVGYALTADSIYFNPENDWITHT